MRPALIPCRSLPQMAMGCGESTENATGKEALQRTSTYRASAGISSGEALAIWAAQPIQVPEYLGS